jgi:predicted nucleotidyltransferase
MTGQKILNFLREKKPYLRKEFGVSSIGLFGSYMHEEEISATQNDP